MIKMILKMAMRFAGVLRRIIDEEAEIMDKYYAQYE